MKTIMSLPKRSLLLALAVLLSTFALGGATQAQAHEGYAYHDGYRHYGYYHHHHGYWRDHDGLRVWINID